jgi:UDP-N-acetylglucosamine:LPS N-acetylglucosamine transferase
LIVSASFGTGHDRAADQIAWRLEDRGLATQRVDLVDLLAIGPFLRGAYRTQIHRFPITWDWLLDFCAHPSATRAATGAIMGAARDLEGLVGPDTVAVVSTYPLASQVIGRMRTTGRLTVPAVTYLTDMSVHPLWISPGIDHHLALHPVAAAQATAHGARGVTVTGPLVAPAFTPATPERKWLARRRFGLPEDERIALVVTGSWGVGQFGRTAGDILATGHALPVVACGGNDAARERLGRTAECLALGWIDDMPSLLHAADVVVQSGGGMTTLEALASGVPVITYRALAGHGRMSAAALEEAGWVLWARDRVELGYLLRHPLAVPTVTPTDGVAEFVLDLAGVAARAAA